MGRLFIVLAALLVLPTSAIAGSWKLKFKTASKMHITIARQGQGECMLITVSAMTADVNPGPCLLRFDGVVISRVEGAPYYYRVPFGHGESITALNNPKLSLGQKDVKPIRMDGDWFLREHTVEAYFVGKDDRGRNKKDRADAPAAQFMLEPDDSPTPGPVISEDQVKEASRQAFEQGRDASKEAWNKEREEFLAKLNELSKELAAEKVRKISVESPKVVRRETVIEKPVKQTIEIGTTYAEKPKTADQIRADRVAILGLTSRNLLSSDSLKLNPNSSQAIVTVKSNRPFAASFISRDGRTIPLLVEEYQGMFLAITYGMPSNIVGGRLVIESNSINRSISIR